MKSLWQLLQHKQTRKTKRPSKATLKNRRINARSVKCLPVDLKASVRVFRETILIGWRSASQVDSVDLGGECSESSWTGPDLFSVVGGAGAVDIEAGDDL